MKSLFKVIMIAMLGIAFTGFGQSTFDPPDNSIAIHQVDENMASVDLNEIVLTETFSVSTEDGHMFVNTYQSNDCEYLVFGNLESVDERNMLVPSDYNRRLPIETQSYQLTTVKSNSETFDSLKPYRTARDGFNHS